MKKQKISSVLMAVIFTVIIMAVGYYIFLPALNIHSVGFWLFILIGLMLLAVFETLFATGNKPASKSYITKFSSSVLTVFAVVLVACVVMMLASSELFRAKKYSQILTVTDGTIEQIPTVSGRDSIALMDTASAEKLGNREIGSLSEVVSQYNVSEYTQIDYEGVPVKVSPLRYAGFFKWMQNRESGIPGYVIVNPVSMEADYHAMDSGMKYVPSAYFSKDLERHIRFHYPTEMFGNVHFEIDEEGKPWYIASTYEHQVGLFGGTQVNGIILINPVTGELQKYAVADVPQWVDVVFHGNLICEQYNNYAQYQKGFFNSIFGQVGCRKVTEYTGSEDDESSYSDYGFIAKDGDIWIYTGVTSVNNDSSNIGFILANERTEQTIFIPTAGADEFSAMASAEGEVQEKGYTASFPSLILIDDKPTYIMVLKDDGGLVKMYACVNVEQYNMVATASTQEACIEKYTALVNGRISQEDATDENTEVEESTEDYEPLTITITKMQTMDVNGNTYLYIVDENDHVYRAKYADVIDMLFVEVGDTITIETDGTNYTYTK